MKTSESEVVHTFSFVGSAVLLLEGASQFFCVTLRAIAFARKKEVFDTIKRV